MSHKKCCTKNVSKKIVLKLTHNFNKCKKNVHLAAQFIKLLFSIFFCNKCRSCWIPPFMVIYHDLTQSNRHGEEVKECTKEFVQGRVSEKHFHHINRVCWCFSKVQIIFWNSCFQPFMINCELLRICVGLEHISFDVWCLSCFMHSSTILHPVNHFVCNINPCVTWMWKTYKQHLPSPVFSSFMVVFKCDSAINFFSEKFGTEQSISWTGKMYYQKLKYCRKILIIFKNTAEIKITNCVLKVQKIFKNTKVNNFLQIPPNSTNFIIQQ